MRRCPTRATSVMAVAAASLFSAAAVLAGAEPSLEIAGGGLVFAGNRAISLVQQDIMITPDRIGLTYALRSESSTPQALTIAFPLPELEAGSVFDGDVQLPAGDPLNYVKAVTTIDGQPVAMRVEQRAYALGLDVTDAIVAGGLDLVPLASDLPTRIATLAPAQQLELFERGIVKDDGTSVVPAWIVRTVAHWRQTIQPRQTITIELAYRPLAGVQSYQAELLPALRKRGCFGATQEAALGKLAASSGATPVVTSITFHISAGADALGPARRFRLIVESGDDATVMASCRDGMKRTGPLQLEWSASDYVLDDDIVVVFAR